jgi:hypothetical protein
MTCTEMKRHLLPSPIDGFTTRDEDHSGKRDSSQRGLHVMMERREREVGKRRSRRRPWHMGKKERRGGKGMHLFCKEREEREPCVCAPEREERGMAVLSAFTQFGRHAKEMGRELREENYCRYNFCMEEYVGGGIRENADLGGGVLLCMMEGGRRRYGCCFLHACMQLKLE